MPLQLTSPGLPPGADIPKLYSCDGSDISPPLAWSSALPGTAGFAVVVEGLDAPGGVPRRWVACNIPAAVAGSALVTDARPHLIECQR